MNAFMEGLSGGYEAAAQQRQLYDAARKQAAQRRAGQAYAAGGYGAAANAMAGDGDIQGAAQTTAFSQGQQDRQAKIDAAHAYASNNLPLAIQNAARTGDADLIRQYQTDASQAAQASWGYASSTARHLLDATSDIKDPQERANALLSLYHTNRDIHAAMTKSSPAEMQTFEAHLSADPVGTLTAVASPAEFSPLATQYGGVVAVNKSNPKASVVVAAPDLTLEKAKITERQRHDQALEGLGGDRVDIARLRAAKAGTSAPAGLPAGFRIKSVPGQPAPTGQSKIIAVR